MLDRRHMRLRYLMDVRWSMPAASLSGQGQVVNISSSGLLLQLDNQFKPADDCIVSLDAPVNEKSFPFSSKKSVSKRM